MGLKKTTSRKYKMPGKHMALSAVLLFLSSPVVMSAEWAFKPSVSMGASHDDNFQLSKVEESASGIILHPKIKLSSRTGISNIALYGQVVSSRYDSNRYDSDAVMLDLRSSFENTERSTFKINAGISRKPLVSTEEEDSGRFELERDRDKITFRPSWEYYLSSRGLLSISYRGEDVDYNGSTAHIDYQYHQLTGGYYFRSSEKNRYSLFLTASRYDPNNTDAAATDENCFFDKSIFGTDLGHCILGDKDYRDPNYPFVVENLPATSNITDSYGFILGVTRDFSPTLSGTVTIGLTRSERTLIRNATPFEIDHAGEFEYMTPAAVSTGLINTVTESTLTTIDASLTKDYELTSVSLDISNKLKPSSNGGLTETSRVGFGVNRKMSSRLSLSADLSATSTQIKTAYDRDFYSAQLGANWSLTRWWRLKVDYRYRQQKYNVSSSSADSNRFAITLAYAWPKKSISR